MLVPLTATKDTWTYITFVYIFFTAVLPMWILKQPRDTMTTYMFIGMIAGAALGLLVAHPTMNLPVFTGFHNDTLGDMFPILFVTVHAVLYQVSTALFHQVHHLDCIQ